MKHNKNISEQAEDSLRQRVGTGGTFPVPGGYFDSFNQRLKSRLPLTAPSGHHNKRRIFIAGGIAAAAAVLVGILFISRFIVTTPAGNGSATYTIHDFLFEPYVSYLVYYTSERTLLQNNDSGNLVQDSVSLPTEWTNVNEKLDPEAVIDYLYYNGNVYSIMDGQ